MDRELQDALADFLGHFELVFDSDWEFTQEILRDPKYYISDDGTFLHPGVEDESNNWANRGSLLNTYRRLKAVVGKSTT